MRRNAHNAVGIAGTLALIGLLMAAFGASSASAIGIGNFEAGTCSAPGCTYKGAPSEFFAQAAGHPPDGVTDFTVNATGESDQAKRVKVELPEGLNVNPVAVPRCPVETFKTNEAACTALGSKVGESQVTTELELIPGSGIKVPIPPLSFDVYNLEPNNGEPALFGFHVTTPLAPVVNEYVYLETSIEWAGDYPESFYIKNIAAFPPLGRNRLIFNGQAGGVPGGGGSFLTLPSACHGDPTTTLS